jgi:DNA damage-binding protein 1
MVAPGNFTSPTDVNLLVAKTDRIEIFQLTEDGLVPHLQVPIYGRVVALRLFRPKV